MLECRSHRAVYTYLSVGIFLYDSTPSVSASCSCRSKLTRCNCWVTLPSPHPLQHIHAYVINTSSNRAQCFN